MTELQFTIATYGAAFVGGVIISVILRAFFRSISKWIDLEERADSVIRKVETINDAYDNLMPSVRRFEKAQAEIGRYESLDNRLRDRNDAQERLEREIKKVASDLYQFQVKMENRL